MAVVHINVYEIGSELLVKIDYRDVLNNTK